MQMQISSADILFSPKMLMTAARKDKVLVKVYEYTSSGWPSHSVVLIQRSNLIEIIRKIFP